MGFIKNIDNAREILIGNLTQVITAACAYMCLLTNTEQLSAGEAVEQKAVTYRENIEGGGHLAR